MFSKLPGSRLISYLSSGFAVIVLMANVASAQNGPPSGELRGEASVLIFDDFETGESELRYFIINAVTGRDTEVFFQGPTGRN